MLMLNTARTWPELLSSGLGHAVYESSSKLQTEDGCSHYSTRATAFCTAESLTVMCLLLDAAPTDVERLPTAKAAINKTVVTITELAWNLTRDICNLPMLDGGIDGPWAHFTPSWACVMSVAD
jgi:hypothetical protein